MPEYLAPGVYVEEVSYRSKSIEGVSTSTTGFVGPTRYGPIELDLEVLTSLLDFERIYGDRQPLEFSLEGRRPNYLWHAARAYFENGGARLYVKRIFAESAENDGRASGRVDSGFGSLRVKARFPGKAGERRVELTLQLSSNVLVRGESSSRLVGVLDRDVVVAKPVPTTANGSFSGVASGASSSGAAASAAAPAAVYSARVKDGAWQFRGAPAGDP